MPFWGDPIAEPTYKFTNEPAPNPRHFREELSGKPADVVVLSLTTRPELRCHGVNQFAADLPAVMVDLAGDSGALSAMVTDTVAATLPALTESHQAAKNGDIQIDSAWCMARVG